METETKDCPRCACNLHVSEFYLTAKGYSSWCQACSRRDNNERYRKNGRNNLKIQQRTFRNKIKREYGMSVEEHQEMLERQSGRCKICNVEVTNPMLGELHKEDGKIRSTIDHCHETGRVRGILCHKCNGGLGQFSDDVELLKKALNYLEEF